MAWTEAGLNNQLDTAITGRVMNISRMIGGSTITDVYVIGQMSPYAGRARWVQVLNSEDDAGAYTALRNALSA
jgi:hypothetical protein